MESLLGRYRNLIILVGVLFLQVLGLAVQVKRSDSGNTRLVRVWAVEAVAPFERVLVSVQNSCGSLWHNYFYLRGVRAENRELKEQIEQMRLEQVRLSQDAEQAHRLQALLAFKEQMVAKTVAAQVIGSSGSDLSRIVYIDKGENDGLKPDMAVVSAAGIVGKILLVSPSVSQVLLINDQSSGVGVILEKSRLQGVLRGTANGEVVLERVMSDEQVLPGEKVLSSGGDQIFPKGMPVGTVTKVTPGKDLFLDIKVKPAADLSRLEEVLVVTEKQESTAVAENGGRVRAADILAERLPSVPDKPPAEASSTNKPATSAGSPTTGATAAAATGTAARPNVGVKPPGTANSAPAASAKPAETAATNPRVSTPSAAVQVKLSESPSDKPSQAGQSQTATSQTRSTAPAAKKVAPQSSAPPSLPPAAKPSAANTQPETPSQDSPH
jgi:rod shape-determining protein MreC